MFTVRVSQMGILTVQSTQIYYVAVSVTSQYLSCRSICHVETWEPHICNKSKVGMFQDLYTYCSFLASQQLSAVFDHTTAATSCRRILNTLLYFFIQYSRVFRCQTFVKHNRFRRVRNTVITWFLNCIVYVCIKRLGHQPCAP